jgi:hypothetical protein
MRSRSAASFVRPMGLLAAILLAAFAGFGPSVLANDTPGNNGTVKIHDGPGEPSSEYRNEPHVCTFHLHFFFADPEQAGTWEIQEWAPTGQKGTVVLSGTYDTHGDGEDRQPEQGVYTLPNGHYKLFWDGDTGKHDKMKVFWVDCPAASGTPAPTGSEQPIESSSPSTAPSESASTAPSESASTAPSESASTAPSESASTAPSGSELPIGGSGSPSASAAPTGSELPISGSASPTGGVEGVVGTPAGATPPPTDTAGVTKPSDESWRAILMGLAALIAAATFLLPSPTSRASRSVVARRGATRRDRR